MEWAAKDTIEFFEYNIYALSLREKGLEWEEEGYDKIWPPEKRLSKIVRSVSLTRRQRQRAKDRFKARKRQYESAIVELSEGRIDYTLRLLSIMAREIKEPETVSFGRRLLGWSNMYLLPKALSPKVSYGPQVYEETFAAIAQLMLYLQWQQKSPR